MARPRDVTRHAYADANLLLALLSGDEHPFHQRAADIFARVDRGELRLMVAPIVLAEVVWSARTALRRSRSEVAAILLDLLVADGLDIIELPLVRRALQLQVAHSRLDFADAYLAARALEVGPTTVASFDQDLDTVPGIERLSA